MKSIIAFIVFGLIFLSILIMVVIYFTYKGIRKLKAEVEESYYRNQKLKEQKERNPFGNDYFKSASTKKKTQPKREKTERYQSEQTEQIKKDKNPFGEDYFKSADDVKKEQAKKEQPRQESPRQKETARSQSASSNVTIIDGRDDECKRKIFDHSDGEYVEFEEV